MAKPKELTKLQKFYVDAHYKDYKAEFIAKDVGADVALVKKYIATLPKPAPAVPPKAVPQPLANNAGAVMTEAASIQGDKDATTVNTEWMARHSKNISKP